MKTKLRDNLSKEDMFLLKIKYGDDLVSVPDIRESDCKYFEKLGYKTIRENIDLITKQMADILGFDSFNGDMWDRILRRIPEFGIYCDWSKLDAQDWDELIHVRPQFAEYRI